MSLEAVMAHALLIEAFTVHFYIAKVGSGEMPYDCAATHAYGQKMLLEVRM